MKKHHAITTVAVCWGAALAFLLFTHPHTLPVGLLVVPFLLMGIALYATFYVMYGVLRPGAHSSSRLRILWALLAFGAMCLLGLQSIGELTFMDGLALLGFLVVTYLYVSRSVVRRSV